MEKGHTQIRILQILSKFDNGGIESFIMNYYRSLDKNKFQFDFVCDENSTIPYENEIKKLGGKIYRLPSCMHLFRYTKEMMYLIKKNKYQIVHANMNTLNVIPLFSSWLAKAPIRICHNHSTIGKGEYKKNIFKYILKPFSKVFPTHLFACSLHAAKWMYGERTVDRGEVYIIKNAIDIKKFLFNESHRNKIRDQLKIGNDSIVIGHVVRFCYQKNQEYLLEIFKNYKIKNNNSKLMLIGDGDKTNFKSLISNYDLKSDVILLESKNNIQDYYSAMDVFILPSRYEGLGMVAIEAQINGLYCYLSNMVPKEAIISKNYSFFDLKNKDIDIRVYNRNTIKNNINFESYDIDKACRYLENIYTSLLDEMEE